MNVASQLTNRYHVCHFYAQGSKQWRNDVYVLNQEILPYCGGLFYTCTEHRTTHVRQCKQAQTRLEPKAFNFPQLLHAMHDFFIFKQHSAPAHQAHSGTEEGRNPSLFRQTYGSQHSQT